MSNYEAIYKARSDLENAETEIQSARLALERLNPDGGELPAVITPTRFEAAYRGFAKAIGHGHDYYDQWTADGQRTCRTQARAVLEAAGFQVQETPR